MAETPAKGANYKAAADNLDKDWLKGAYARTAAGEDAGAAGTPELKTPDPNVMNLGGGQNSNYIKNIMVAAQSGDAKMASAYAGFAAGGLSARAADKEEQEKQRAGEDFWYWQLQQNLRQLQAMMDQYRAMANWYGQQVEKVGAQMDKIAEKMAENSEFLTAANDLLEEDRQVGHFDVDAAKKLLEKMGINTDGKSPAEINDILKDKIRKTYEDNAALNVQYHQLEVQKEEWERKQREAQAAADNLQTQAVQIATNANLTEEEKAEKTAVLQTTADKSLVHKLATQEQDITKAREMDDQAEQNNQTKNQKIENTVADLFSEDNSSNLTPIFSAKAGATKAEQAAPQNEIAIQTILKPGAPNVSQS